MFASYLQDTLAAFGCMSVTLGLVAVAGFLIALRMGMFPAISEKLKKLGEKDEVREKLRD